MAAPKQVCASCAGWMALLLSEEKTDSFVAVHNATLQLLKVELSTCHVSHVRTHGALCACPTSAGGLQPGVVTSGCITVP